MPDYNPQTSVSLVETVREKIQQSSGTPSTSSSQRRSEIISSIQELSSQRGSNKNLGDIIKLLTELRDFDNGINWIEVDSPNGGLNILIRDARGVKDQTSNKYYGQLIMAMNHLRAANSLLEVSGIKDQVLDVDIQLLVSNLMSTPLKSDDECLKIIADFNRQLNDKVSQILNVPKEDSAKLLVKARDFANFEDETRHIVTVDKVPGRKDQLAIQAEVVCTELTQKQKDEYLYKAEKKWYTSLSKWEKRLIRKYESKILDGKHSIPTQLRNCLVGVRNAGMKITAVVDTNVTASSKDVLDCSFHSGTVGHLGKKCGDDENERITVLNAEQMQELSGKKAIHMLTLNAENNISGNDPAIVRYSSNSMKKLGFSHSNLCFNPFRYVFPNRYAGVEKKLKFLGSHFLHTIDEINFKSSGSIDFASDPALQKDLINYLQNSRSIFNRTVKSKDLLARINAWERANSKVAGMSEIVKYMKHAINCRSAINGNSSFWNTIFFRDKDNRNLTIGANIHNLDNYLRDLMGDQIFEETFSACQSGKDRNGVLMTETSNLAISSDARLKDIPDIRQRITLQTAKSSHHAFMAGVQGGTIGCFGIKEDSRFAIPDRYGKETEKLLVQKEAGYNKKIFGALDKKRFSLFRKKSKSIDFISVKKVKVRSAQSRYRGISYKKISGDFKKPSKKSIDKKVKVVKKNIERCRTSGDFKQCNILHKKIQEIYRKSIRNPSANARTVALELNENINMLEIHLDQVTKEIERILKVAQDIYDDVKRESLLEDIDDIKNHLHFLKVSMTEYDHKADLMMQSGKNDMFFEDSHQWHQGPKN